MGPVTDARRTPRLRLRAPAVISFRNARLDVLAEDLGPDGCRLVGSLALRRGEAVYVTVFLPGPLDPLSASASVAWSSATSPHRTGLSFARPGHDERARRIRELIGKDPALARVPASLRPNQRLRLGPLPGPGVVLGRDELIILRAARDGATVTALFESAGRRFREVRTALATLRARGLVHEGVRRPPATAWPELLGLERLAPPPVEPVTDPFAPVGRPIRALCFLETAREQSAHGHLGAAVEWLQHALAAAPNDAEISDALEALTVGDAEGEAPSAT